MRKAEKRTIKDRTEYEIHHVFPKSIYGDNDKVVRLYLREHYVAHKLLWKACRKRYGLNNEKTRKMAMAFHKMVYCKGDTHRNITKSSLYESARQACREAKIGKKRKDMEGKIYFGASEERIRAGIEKMRQKKIGMKVDYPANRKSSPRNGKIAQKISAARLQTKSKYVNMTIEEFAIWISKQNLYAKDGRKNPNVTRAILARKEKLETYYG